tara:strand:+ start:59484 stop:59882 length:399 start_codon:yes stop_codon:yes gene_type:complete
MENLELKSTPRTPEILFNATTGEMIIRGRAIPLESEEFWAPVLKWFYAYATDPQQKTRFVFDMEYFNISSSKKILFLLHKLNDLLEVGFDVDIEWRYPKGDIEMKEAGSDFSCMVNIPIRFVETEESLATAV